MVRFIISRILQAVVVIFAIITITFFMGKAVPGGPFANERQTTPHIEEALNAYYGLDQPTIVQFGRYLSGFIRGDLGPSFKYEGRSINEILGDSLPISATLGGMAFLFALVIGLPIGILAAARRNTVFDYVPMSLAMVGICLPTFVMGPLLAIFFGIKLNWFNVALWIDSTDWVLPSLTLGLYYAAYVARLTRAGMLDTLSQDYIRTARAKGASEFSVLTKHGLKGGLQPVLAFMGPAFAGMLAGSFVIEKVFRIPGLGTHFIEAALNRDITLLIGTAVFYGTLLLLLNLIVDIVQILTNPKLTFSS
ncbi:MAG: ABC transporter permease [Verrucomicrobiota bacterium]